jgi:ferritin-like metal-binding protein YciE
LLDLDRSRVNLHQRSARSRTASTSDAKDQMADISAADTKLVQYLNEAYGLEKRLETALEAHIAMTTHAAYKKRLKEHLAETKRHGREVKKRIKQLGGEATTIEAPGPAQVTDAAQAVLSGAHKAAALAQGPLHALRGTGQEEKHLKNAKTEYASESEEIATYSAIETLAEALGDGDTKKLAHAIRREEERMRSYLEKEIPRFTKAVAIAEIPASQRRKPVRAKKAKAAGGRAKAPSSSAARATAAKAKTKPRAKAKSRAATKPRATAKARTAVKAKAGRAR